jgi:hypothetical protein
LNVCVLGDKTGLICADLGFLMRVILSVPQIAISYLLSRYLLRYLLKMKPCMTFWLSV